jgi:hypothetical protein
MGRGMAAGDLADGGQILAAGMDGAGDIGRSAGPNWCWTSVSWEWVMGVLLGWPWLNLFSA